MKKFISALIVLICITVLQVAPAQSQSLCTLTHNPNPQSSGAPSQYARAALNQILGALGIQFGAVPIYRASVGNAAAFRTQQGVYIAYEPGFMNQMASYDPAAASSVLAHEVGHLIGNQQNHPNSHVRELQADRISGCVMRRLNATYQQATLAQQLMPSSGSQSHPPTYQRIQQINVGYSNPGNCQ